MENTVEQVMAEVSEKLESTRDAAWAVSVLKDAKIALEYLESKAQGSVNKDVDTEAAKRAEGHNADGKNISDSFKSQSALVKTLRMIDKSIGYGELVAKFEATSSK